MKRFSIIPLILFISLWAAMLNADIYTWTDENGVRHFTNNNPPKQAKLMIKAAEYATDEKAVQEQIEAKRLERQQLELQEIAEKQTLISMKQQALEEQLEEADRKAQEAIKRSEEIFDDAPGVNEDYDDFRDGGEDVEVIGPTYGYYPYYPYNSYRSYFKQGLYRPNHFKYRKGYQYRKHYFDPFGKHRFQHFNKHHIGKFHHAKGRPGFKRRSHHSRGHFRGGHRSTGHSREGHRGSRRK